MCIDKVVPTFQICASAKCATCACDNGDVEGWFIVEPSPDAVQFNVPFDVDAIE